MTVLLTIGISGCSSSETVDRSAQPAAASSSVSDNPTQAAQGQAAVPLPEGSPQQSSLGVSATVQGTRGSRICVFNDTTGKLPIHVTWTLKDGSEGPSELAPGQRACGWGHMFTAPDVTARISYPSAAVPVPGVTVIANNPHVGTVPSASITHDGSSRTCSLPLSGIFPNGKVAVDDGHFRYLYGRTVNSTRAEFELHVQGTTQQRVACQIQ